MKPIVAIVGRPNVGKSMLFNKLIGRRLSIVEDTPGVTRDRIYGESDWNGRTFTLIDTGGIEPRTDSKILDFMREQAQIAIDNATVIIFLTDIKTGLTASDHEVANMLLRSGKPVVLAVNKMDSTGVAGSGLSMSFITWGWGIPLPSPPSTATAPAICWTPACPVFPAGGGGGRGGRRHSGGRHRQAQRRQILPGQPDSGGGAGDCLRCGRHHPGRHRLPL